MSQGQSEAPASEAAVALDRLGEALGQLEAALLVLRRYHSQGTTEAGPSQSQPHSDVDTDPCVDEPSECQSPKTVRLMTDLVSTGTKRSQDPVADDLQRSKAPMSVLLTRRSISLVVASVQKRDFLSEREQEDSEPVTVPEIEQVNINSSSCEGLPHTMDQVMMTRDSCTFNPFSKGYSLYAMLSLVVLSHDIVFVPLAIAWNLLGNRWCQVLGTITWMFWAMDVIVSFNTGIYAGGELIMARRAICKRYLRTWFLMDASVLVIDGLLLLLPEARLGGSMVRAFKLLRLIRFARAPQMMASMDPLGMQQRHQEVLTSLLKNFGWIILVNHWLACTWFVVGHAFPSDTGHRWVDDPSFVHGNIWYEYTTCLHWSLTQMTPGSMQVFPTNSAERIMNVACLLVGMMVFSTLISSLSAQMNEHVKRSRGRRQLLHTLEIFLKSSRVSRPVAVAIERRIAEGMSKKQTRPVVLGDVEAVNFLPSALHRCLTYEVCSKQLTPSLFRIWRAVDGGGFASLCMAAVHMQALCQDDVAFAAHADCPAMHILTQGRLIYELSREKLIHLDTGAQLSELALWAKWSYLGTATASQNAVLLSIDADLFGSIAVRNRIFRSLALDLGQACCQWAVQNLRFVSDVIAMNPSEGDIFRRAGTVQYLRSAEKAVATPEGVKTTSLLEVVLPTMALASRLLVARVAAQLDRRSGLVNMDILREEVSHGTALYIPSDTGQMVRIVQLQVLEIRNDDGALLVSLGQAKHGRLALELQLPGVRQLAGEPGTAAVDRVLKERLPTLVEHISWSRFEVSVAWQRSRHTGAATKYVRVTHKAELDEGVDLDIVDWMPLISRMQAASTIASGRSNGGSSPKGRPGPEALDLRGVRQPDGTLGVYAWLRRPELEYYQTAEGEKELGHFFEHMRLRVLGTSGAGPSSDSNIFSGDFLAGLSGVGVADDMALTTQAQAPDVGPAAEEELLGI